MGRAVTALADAVQPAAVQPEAVPDDFGDFRPAYYGDCREVLEWRRRAFLNTVTRVAPQVVRDLVRLRHQTPPALRQWARRWHLPDWCVEWAADTLLKWRGWTDAVLIDYPFWDHRPGFAMLEFEVQTFAPGWRWDVRAMSRAYFMERARVGAKIDRANIRRAVAANVASFEEHLGARYGAGIGQVVVGGLGGSEKQAHAFTRQRLAEYCDEVERLARKAGWKPFPRARPEHFVCAVRYIVLQESFAVIHPARRGRDKVRKAVERLMLKLA